MRTGPISRAVWSGAVIFALAAMAQPAAAQDADAPRGSDAYVTQAPELGSDLAAPSNQADAQPVAQTTDDAPSRVYFPRDINEEAMEAANQRRAAQSDQLADRAPPRENAASSQIGGQTGDEASLAQLSDEQGVRALAQLTAAERQVLLDAVEGTDICDTASDIPAVRALCAQRLETRSSDFAQDNQYRPSAEERLLGEALDGDRASDMGSVVARAARGSGEADNFANQVIASVALSPGQSPSADTPAGDDDATGELSAETQSLINAIVEQFGGNTGTP